MMIFIGIVTDIKSENYIKKIQNNNSVLKKYHIIFIRENSIDNIKNIKFETIIVNREFEDKDSLNKLIAKSEYVIVNEDIGTIIDLLKDIKSNIITYGFNSKSTITMSSVTDDSIQVSVQRNIISKKSEVEQQEISLNKEAKSDVYDIMLLISLLLIHNNEDINNVKF
ncbi:MAG TPA: hypothetical protein OIM42_04615 [Clostridiaceae bacterium]|jgi:hypothetical protein|nr:hypothetical protein [Clostridiaceae bacterium]HJJ14122.1 hypothetical protein [Clostridiaceae bacterium]